MGKSLNMKTYKINLIWEKLDDQIYGEREYACVFFRHYLNVSFNGDNWYNVVLEDSYGGDVAEIPGGRTIEDAKANAEKWLIEVCENFLIPNNE